MSLKDYEPRIAKSALHRKEEHVKQVFRDQVAEAAGLLEVVLSAIVLVALLLSVAPLLQLLPGLLTHGNSVEVREFLERALDIVIGIEFIKMLAKHSPGSVLEVLLYAIARHMIVGHEDAVQNLVSVGAIALIFIIRKFFFVPSFGHKMPGGDLAPDIKEKEKEEESKSVEHIAGAHSVRPCNCFKSATALPFWRFAPSPPYRGSLSHRGSLFIVC